MKVKHDKFSNAAYIFLKDEFDKIEIKNSYDCDIVKVDGMIRLDFDKDKKLIGIDIFGASEKLPKELLDNAERVN